MDIPSAAEAGLPCCRAVVSTDWTSQFADSRQQFAAKMRFGWFPAPCMCTWWQLTRRCAVIKWMSLGLVVWMASVGCTQDRRFARTGGPAGAGGHHHGAAGTDRSTGVSRSSAGREDTSENCRSSGRGERLIGALSIQRGWRGAFRAGFRLSGSADHRAEHLCRPSARQSHSLLDSWLPRSSRCHSCGGGFGGGFGGGRRLPWSPHRWEPEAFPRLESVAPGCPKGRLGKPRPWTPSP